MRTLSLLAGAAALVALAACSRSSSDRAVPTATAVVSAAVPPATTGAMAASSATAATSAAGVASGPTASVPAGKLVAGTACGDQPRSPGEELAGESLELTAFDIDAYPYPNDPTQPPRTGVSREEAGKLCAARGRRLCSELEWERACKGPKNTRYEYGDRFDAKACPTGLGAVASLASFPGCVSGFGVHAMHGYLWEWTASDWKRGKQEGKAVERGGYGNQPYAHMRCSNARAAAPSSTEASVGFRCCGGAANPREVEIAADDPAPAALVAETTLDDALLGRLKRALVNGQFKDPEGTTSTFAKVWRWHPAPKEELLLVRYESKTAEGATTVQPLVVRLCEKNVQLIGRLRAAVESMEEPTVKEDTPGTAVVAVAGAGSKGDVKLTYQFSQVATDQPAWVKAGTAPGASASAAPAASR